MSKTITTIATEHVDIHSSRDFEATAKALEAELGRASTRELMERLSAAPDWQDYAAQCAALAGPSNLIEVGHLNWGGVLTLSGLPMKVRCFIIGNPLTAQKLLAAGGPSVGLYLPTKILVSEASDGTVHIAYDRFRPVFAPLGDDALSTVATAIDDVLERLAKAAAGDHAESD